MVSKRLLYVRMLLPLARLAWHYLDEEDVWVRLPHQVPLELLGGGCTKELGWYLRGETRIHPGSVDGICRWLRRCEYVHDQDLFNTADFWQHPTTFEQIRRGDCEDHALWAWRKLREIGLPAEFFVGRWLAEGEPAEGLHAWVVFQERGEEHLLECVSKERRGMAQPLHRVRNDYVPHFSVDGDLRLSMYGGFVQYLQRRSGRPKPPPAGPEA
jgi:hypothetical protein